MILVDTSVWIDHFRKGVPELAALLQEGQVLIHPLVIEELACGVLNRRREILNLLELLPKTLQASHLEFLDFIGQHRLEGKGLGVVDTHLLASTRLNRAQLWTRDKPLCRTAKRMGLAAKV